MMHRRRQVRLRYPQAFVELTLVLGRRHGLHRAARALGLPLSTVYRWRDGCRRPLALPDDVAALAELIGACAAHGFDLRQRVTALEPAVDGAFAAGARPPLAHDRNGTRGDDLRSRPQRPDGAAAEAVTSLSPAVRARVQLARDAIDARYYAPLSCEQLATLAGMSRFHFIRTFKTAYGVAPYRYLLQVRIRRARHLLSTTPQPLDAIAAAVGFDSPSLLSKAFKSVEGISLARYFEGVRLGARPPVTAARAVG